MDPFLDQSMSRSQFFLFTVADFEVKVTFSYKSDGTQNYCPKVLIMKFPNMK